MTTHTHSLNGRVPAGTPAAGLALLGAVTAIPLGLAQLDLAGLVDVFSIEIDAPGAVLAIAGIGGGLTLITIAIAAGGAVLAALGSPRARPVLVGTAVAGFATALLLWLPHAMVLMAAAGLIRDEEERR